ncbi:amidohydrolase family protein [Paraglaciecola aquimarina]|uniref:Amidohydrolase family protein n=1 Tax=Paraglaciecola aquimarina TaxID=1235557 RepID=A0ABU3SX39_9ALTE|nr:amidohydrolase family protein [Paraglaciecola aquimarina]MDU0354542.1 amidohydrolase family protein [Paraglaciecola aquimarina]
MAVTRPNDDAKLMSPHLHKIIDPHLHFFALHEGDYAWLKPDNPPSWPDKQKINRTYVQQDLVLPSNVALAGLVHIEAGFDNQHPWKEIDWLEHHCTLPFKSVAFADLTSRHFSQQIAQLTQRESVVGIRHILDQQAHEILTSDTIQQHFKLLQDYQLSFDAQLSVENKNGCDALLKLAQQYPSVKIILNHGGWPPDVTSQQRYRSWQANLKQLATCENVALKLSAWEMLQAGSTDLLDQILAVSLHTFGQHRVMLASNFPVCLLASSYTQLWNKYLLLIPTVGLDCWQNISYQNALNWYRLDCSV